MFESLPAYFCLVLLLLDNYDSFTYNLYDYFLRCGAEVEVIRNDKIKLEDLTQKYKGVILSPGPGKPEDAGQMMSLIKQCYNKLPIFGVCLGMQAIGEFFGADLIQANYPMHGKMSNLKYNANHPLFFKIKPPLQVCRYHSLVLNNIQNTPLNLIASSNKDEPMAIAHHTLPIWGVQFHPEAILTPQGLQLINNWLSCIKSNNKKKVQTLN